MNIDIKRLEHDADYWDEVAPEGAKIYRTDAQLFSKWDGDMELISEKKSDLWADSPWPWPIEKHRSVSNMVERPTKPSAPEWDGSDRPPIGIWVEHNKHGHFTTTRIIGYDESLPICTHGEGKYYGVPASCMRPIRTKEEKEKEELETHLQGILPFCEYTDDQIKELAAILYTQGYRKPQEAA